MKKCLYVRPPGAISGNLQQKYLRLHPIFFSKMKPVSTRRCGALNSLAGVIGGNAQSARLFRGPNRR